MTKAPTNDSGEASTAKEKVSGEFVVIGALYKDYSGDFSSKYFSEAMVASSVRNIKARGFTRDNLLWGYYQKFAVSDPTDQSKWGKSALYQNWESAVAEAREGLAKVQVDRNLPGPDPDNPSARARNMLEHLDTAVRIALFDKHLPGSPIYSGIQIEVVVGVQAQPSRRHKVTTLWRSAPDN